jgi:circadian clock protein KaiC
LREDLKLLMINMTEVKHFWDKKENAENENSMIGSISQKEYPSGVISRVPTGIDGLDSIIEGGIKRGSAVLVEGGAGSGKSIFCTQFIVNGIERVNENGVYISFEEEKDDFFINMKRFGWDLAEYEDKGKFAYLRYTPEQVEKVLSGGGGLVRDIVEKIGAKRIVIDSITAFTMLHSDELVKREAILNLFRTIKKWGCTTLVIGQPEGESDLDGHPFALEFECDGVIRLYNIREHNLRIRTIEVFKMRATKHASKTFTMEITDKGIVIYPDSTNL